jgi:hypothetical protein
MPHQYPWYEVVPANYELAQGDILFNVPSYNVDRENEEEPLVNLLEANVIIMSQSCDLQNKNLDVILWCPFYPLNEQVLKLIDNPTEKAIRKTKEKLRKGEFIQFYLLNAEENLSLQLNFQVVDLKNPRSTSYEEFMDFTLQHGDRLRLLSPYKEHLSQSFARVFMRVGLPDIIPSFEKNRL